MAMHIEDILIASITDIFIEEMNRRIDQRQQNLRAQYGSFVNCFYSVYC